MYELLKKIYRNILKIMPTKIVLNIENFRGYHKFVNFKNPVYWGEKIQWLKLNGNLEKYTKYVDKFRVREYVEKCIGKEHLIPLIGVYDSPEEIDYDKLPEQFVLKLNTGSGYNIIIKNKQEINKKQINKKLNQWLKEDYSQIKKEPQYKFVKKKIICEQFLNDSAGKLLDYKFFCFNGKPEFLKVDYDRYTEHRANYYDINWKKMDLVEGKFLNYKGEEFKPKNYEKMLDIVKKLCELFAFVRVDLYNIDGKIYFGELTFTPAAGTSQFKPLEKDKELAKLIDINEMKQRNKVLYFGSMGLKSKRLDGVTIKSRCLFEYMLNQNIILKYIDVDNYKQRFFYMILEFIKFYRTSDTIVICSSSKGAYMLIKILSMLKCKKKIFYFVSGGVLGDRLINNKYKSKYYRNINEIYVESEFMKVQFNQMNFNNVKVIHNFREFEDNSLQRPKVVENEIKFVFYGRVIKEKGIERAIQLVNKLNEEDLNCSLSIYGQVDNKYLDTLKKQFTDKISYEGEIIPDNCNEYKKLSKYDVFIFPTEWEGEGLPGALIDAYIAGLAVVVSNWKYAKEYVKDGVNGVIFEYKNYEDMYFRTKKMILNEDIFTYKKESLRMSKQYLAQYVLKDFSGNLIKREENK